MKTPNNDDQFKFLISCIKHASNGKIDFDKVAIDCEIVTKGAAAKRYERMMKAHGVYQPTGPFGRDTGVQPLRAKKSVTDGASPSKKRKRAPVKVKASDDDDHYSLAPSANGEDNAEESNPVKDEEDDAGEATIKRENRGDDSPDEADQSYAHEMVKEE